jgi:hypothetical protein
LQKEPWTDEQRILWKHNRHWYEVRPDGYVRNENSFGIYWYLGLPDEDDSLYDRAYAAVQRLGRLGYACRHKILCCPGEACHRNDRVVWKLTREGEEFLARIKPRIPEPVLAAPLPPALPPPGLLFRIWSRLRGRGAGPWSAPSSHV